MNNLVKQKENKKMLWVYRFKLRFYSSFLFKKDSESKMRKGIGEPPVVYDSSGTQSTVKIMGNYLKNKGYYSSQISYREKIRKSNKKKLKVIYTIKTGPPTVIGSVKYDVEQKGILKYIEDEKHNSKLTIGTNFDLDELEKERVRITKVLKNDGLFFFSNDLIYYHADTIKESGKAHLTMRLKQDPVKMFKDTIAVDPYISYKINNIYLHQKADQSSDNVVGGDTIENLNYKFINGEDFTIRPKVLTRALFLAPRDFYTLEKHESTFRRLSGLNNYKFISINYSRSSDLDTNYFLDCHIDLSPSKPKSFNIETNGTNTGGNLGINGAISIQNRNTFKGAETLRFRLAGGIEAQSVRSGDEDVLNQTFNTFEFGPEISIEFPKFLLPFDQDNFAKRYIPKTTISVSYNYQQRPDYTRGLVNTNLNYWFKESRTKSHSIQPVNLSQIKIDKTDDFQARLDSINNRALTASYEDVFITSLVYNFVFNNQTIQKESGYQILRGNAEFAGNVIYALSENFLNLSVDENGQYLLNGIPYSQFFRTYLEYIHNLKLNKGNSIVGRAFAGVGVPYGNAKVLPFVRSFFSGGTNGIRAWQARTIGPGTTPDSITTEAKVDQIGDVKLELNLEYRFKIISFLEGAVFTDIGNIWVLNKTGEFEPEAEFAFDKIINDLAIGVGVGARLNFNFFIVRFDVATRVKDPGSADPTSIKWRRNVTNPSLIDLNPVFNFAIGYPF